MIRPCCLFAAPEVLGGGSYNAKMADVWSCGVMLYVMLYNTYPFNPMPISKGKLNFPSKPRVSEEAQCLIKQILVGPKARIKLADMCRHPWVTKVCQLVSRSAITHIPQSIDIHVTVHLPWPTLSAGWLDGQ